MDPPNLEELAHESVMMEQPSADAESAKPTLSSSASSRLLSLEGVEGIGAGENDTIVVFIRDASVASNLPAAIEGRGVTWRVSGSIGLRDAVASVRR